MYSTLQELLGRTTLEEREVIERWFQNFQAIGLSKRQGMSTARGAAKINQVLDALNPELARRIIPIGGPDSLLRASEAVAAGEVVAAAPHLSPRSLVTIMARRATFSPIAGNALRT